MNLAELTRWVTETPDALAEEMRPMARSIGDSFQVAARRLMELGLGYLTLDRAASTLSTGERQRMQLARAVRNRTTGVLYVLDEPSIGLHPANIAGLTGSCVTWWPMAIRSSWWIMIRRSFPRRIGSLKWGLRPGQGAAG